MLKKIYFFFFFSRKFLASPIILTKLCYSRRWLWAMVKKHDPSKSCFILDNFRFFSKFTKMRKNFFLGIFCSPKLFVRKFQNFWNPDLVKKKNLETQYVLFEALRKQSDFTISQIESIWHLEFVQNSTEQTWRRWKTNKFDFCNFIKWSCN